MAYNGAQWDEANPTNNTLANEIDDIARDIKIGVRGRMAQEHIWPSAQSATAEGGLHKYVTFAMQTSPPDLVIGTNTQVGALYVTSGNSLVFRNSASDAVTVVASGGRSALPPGSITAYGGASAPDGFYLCNGTAVSRTTDAALYAAIGVAYGTGDGSLTFNVPDLRGSVIVCKSAGGIFANLAASTGELTHVLTIAEMPSHTHSNPLYTRTGSDADKVSNGSAPATGTAVTSATGNGDAHNNVQPSVVCNYIIAR